MFGTQNAYIEYAQNYCHALHNYSAIFRRVKTPQDCAAILLKRKSNIVDPEAVSAAAGGLQHLTMTKASLSQARHQIDASGLARCTQHALHLADTLDRMTISNVNAYVKEEAAAG